MYTVELSAYLMHRAEVIGGWPHQSGQRHAEGWASRQGAPRTLPAAVHGGGLPQAVGRNGEPLQMLVPFSHNLSFPLSTPVVELPNLVLLQAPTNHSLSRWGSSPPLPYSHCGCPSPSGQDTMCSKSSLFSMEVII